jgi:hypothetical protein
MDGCAQDIEHEGVTNGEKMQWGNLGGDPFVRAVRRIVGLGVELEARPAGGPVAELEVGDTAGWARPP